MASRARALILTAHPSLQNRAVPVRPAHIAIPPAPLRTERHECRSGTWSNAEEAHGINAEAAHDINAEEAHDIAFPIQRFEAEPRATAWLLDTSLHPQ